MEETVPGLNLDWLLYTGLVLIVSGSLCGAAYHWWFCHYAMAGVFICTAIINILLMTGLVYE